MVRERLLPYFELETQTSLTFDPDTKDNFEFENNNVVKNLDAPKPVEGELVEIGQDSSDPT